MSHSRIARGASVLVVALLGLSGCTFGPGTSTQGSSSPTESLSSSAAFVSFETVKTFKLGNRRSGYLAVTPKAAFISASPQGGDRPSQLLRLDLSTGKQSLVASSQWTTGEIESVAASGNWVVWEDQSDSLSTGSPGGSMTVLWRVWAENLKTGLKLRLDTNGSAKDPLPPVLVSGDGYVAWTHPASGGAPVRQMAWKVGDGHAQTVLLDLSSKSLEHFGGASAIAGGKLIFVLPAATRLGRTYGAGDCWSAPIDGTGKPRQLTHSGIASWCSAVGTDLVWTELSANPKNADPHVLKMMSLDGTSEPRTIHEGQMSARPLVGGGFALWFSGKPTNVSALGSTASTTFAGGAWVWQGTASGSLVAYPSGGKRATVTVIRVVMGAQ